jgi:hypothetical protein
VPETQTQIPKFRELYPQYNDMPDDSVLVGMHKNYYPDMKYNDFVKSFTDKFGMDTIKEDLKSNDVGRFESAMGSIGQSFVSAFGDVGKSMAILLAEPTEFDPTTMSSYRWGERLQKFAQRAMPTNPKYQEEFLISTLPSAVGSMAFFMLWGLAARGLGAGVATQAISSGVAGAAAMSGSAWDEAMEETGGDREKAWTSYYRNAGLGATEALPIARIFNKWDKASGRLLSSFVKNWSTRKGIITGVQQGGEEFLQEFGQTIGENLSAKQLYDFERDIMAGAFEGGAAGFILGTLLSGVGVGIQVRKAKKKGVTEEELELLDDAYNNIQENAKNQATALLTPEDVQRQLRAEADQQQQQAQHEQQLQQQISEEEQFQPLEEEDLLTEEEKFYRDYYGADNADINTKRADDVAQEIGMSAAELTKEAEQTNAETQAIEAGATGEEIQELADDLTDHSKEQLAEDVEATISNPIDSEIDPKKELVIEEGGKTTLGEEVIIEEPQKELEQISVEDIKREEKRVQIDNNKQVEYIDQHSTENISDEHQEENVEDPDDKHFETSVEDDQPAVGANNVTVELFTQGTIEKDQILESALRVRNRARKNTQEEFTNWVRQTYPNLKIDDAYVAKVYRRENSLEEMNVLDVDVVGETMHVNDSSFHNEKSKRQSNKYLLDEVLLPYKDEIAIFNIYNSENFLDKTNPRSKVMPYNRTGTVRIRDLSIGDLKLINRTLYSKGYTLAPVSDSDTFMAIKIPNNIIRSKQSKEKKISQARDAFLEKVLGYWYNGEMDASEVAKRFKLFMPKGEKLKFNRNLKLQVVDDVVHPNSTLLATDGTTYANPKTYKEFLKYNELGDVKQHKTIITYKDADKLVGIKHLTHVLTPQEWTRLTSELGLDKDMDMIVFDSAAKIANKSDGSRYESKETFELPAEAFRHIFTGNDHKQTTFSRQVFNYLGADPTVLNHVNTGIVDKIANAVKLEYEGYEKSPRSLQEFMQKGMKDIPENISDIRRYISVGAVHFKALRNAVRSFLKTRLIDKKFVKLQQEGNFSYLKPDVYNEVKRGDIHVSYPELGKIFFKAFNKGFKKYGPDFGKYTSIGNFAEKNKQLEKIRVDLNEFLKSNPIEVLTSRPPIPKVDNVQVLKVRNIRAKAEGNAAIMNTQDAIENKEADFDGDEVFFHYLDNDTDLKKIADFIKTTKNNVGEVTLESMQFTPASDNAKMYQVGANAGLGKKAVGESAKAIGVKAILLANNVSVGKFKTLDENMVEGFSYEILTKENESNTVETFDLVDDWSDWDWKMAHTLQAAVDNLKTGAMSGGKDWIVEDGIVLYNRADIYAQMFKNGNKQMVRALQPILEALNVFSRNFDEGGAWNQNQVNATAHTYRMNDLVKNGYLGKAPQERMVLHMADMGYLAGNAKGEGPKQQVINSVHDNAYTNSVASFREQYIDKTPAENLKEGTKKRTENYIKNLYIDKAKIDNKQLDDTYSALYERYRNRLESVPDAVRDYADYLIIRGYTPNKDLTGAVVGNTRSILSLISNKNLKRFTDIFNKNYNRLWDAKRGAVEGRLWGTGSGVVGFLGGGFGAPDTALSYRFKKAIANLFNRVFIDLRYGKKDQRAYEEQVGLIDTINKQLYEIGRLPFSDSVSMRALYEKVARKQGVDLAKDDLKAGYGKAVLIELRHLRRALKTGKNLNNFDKYLYFTEDLFRRNPLTAKYINSINDDSNKKDADTDKFLTRLSNSDKNNGIRELLDLKNVGDVKESRMHAATLTLNMLHEVKRQEELGNQKKAQKLLAKVNKIRSVDIHVAKQMDILDDFVKALDGQVDNPEQYLHNKHGDDVSKAYGIARELLDDVIDYDIITWDESIGDPDNQHYEVEVDGKKIKRESWQWKQLQKLRSQLRKMNWKPERIENLIEDMKIQRPQRRENYYPHVYFGYDMDGGGNLDFLQNHETFGADEIAELAKGIRNWKQRRKETQTLEDMADRNPFSVIARRVNSSVNARWTNRFKKNYREMLLNIHKGMRGEAKKGSPDTIKMLIELRHIADTMYKDVTNIPSFSWIKSFGNLVKGLYLTNLLLLSTRGVLRNTSQGIGPNIIQYGGKKFKDGAFFDGAVEFADGKKINIFDDLGISRADIFAKVEGGQEWDIHKSFRDIIALQEASRKGGGAKYKILAKQYMRSVEAGMNKFVKIAGENNIFWLLKGFGKKAVFSLLRKTGKNKYIIPEMPSTKLSFSGQEKFNRRLTAAMGFLEMWKNLRAAQSDMRKGMKKDALASLDEQNYKDALKHARNMIDRVQFNYNMWNRPIGLRGPVKSTLFQFKSFTLGMIKLHWNWWFDFWFDPRGEFRKFMWFTILATVTELASRYFEKDFWRFFELPEYEFVEHYRNWQWGSANERKWAWYGNRASPFTGPVGGMVFEGMVGAGIADKFGMYDSDTDREFLAWMRLVEAHAPFVREVNDISMRVGRQADNDIDFEKAVAEYLGLFDRRDWIITKPKPPSPNKPKKYKGAIRELFK